jgi:hypothetical protein
MSVKDLTDAQILAHLKKNTILRNNQLSVFIRLLNSLNDSATIAIDGAWGSGKTVFVKQFCMLADENTEDFGHDTLDDAEIEKLRNSQKVFYFNAWENDYLGDALSAVLLKLIADSDEGFNEAALKRAASMINPSAAIKNLTHDLINLDGQPKKDKLIENIKSVIDRHDAINDFLDLMKSNKNKRIVFIIDELDRCKPSFAVDLLEVIKHYFVRKDVTFIITANIAELTHTIKKYYGYQFDGYLYLNKFFDFTIGLQRINIENYARDALNWVPNSYVVHEVAHDAIRYYNFSMREINAYHSSLFLIERFLGRGGNWREEQYPVQLIFVPLALALKIKNNINFTAFATGNGEKILRDFLPHTGSGMHYAERWVKERGGLSEEQVKVRALDALVEQYKILFTPEGYRGVREDLQDFDDAISLISSYTTISEQEEEEK